VGWGIWTPIFHNMWCIWTGLQLYVGNLTWPKRQNPNSRGYARGGGDVKVSIWFAHNDTSVEPWNNSFMTFYTVSRTEEWKYYDMEASRPSSTVSSVCSL
jgi:hypothetical protein